MAKFPVYLALRRADGSEPDSQTGYQRIYLGEVTWLDMLVTFRDVQAAFNDVINSDYGVIVDYCMFDCAEGGQPLWIWTLSEPVYVHVGTIPVVQRGKLLLGVDVSAQVVVTMSDQCSM